MNVTIKTGMTKKKNLSIHKKKARNVIKELSFQ